MSTEENKGVMRRFIDASVSNDQTAFRELMAPDFVAHAIGGVQGREAFLQHNSVFASAFSDKQFTVEAMIAEGDMVTARGTWRGVHTGNFQGLPPSGKQVEIGAMLIDRVKDGRIVEHWSMFDMMRMMQQLGMLPTPSSKP